MTDISQLALKVDSSDVEEATAAVNRLTQAFEALNAELEKLGDKRHGGVTLTMVGGVAEAEVKPYRGDA